MSPLHALLQGGVIDRDQHHIPWRSPRPSQQQHCCSTPRSQTLIRGPGQPELIPTQASRATTRTSMVRVRAISMNPPVRRRERDAEGHHR